MVKRIASAGVVGLVLLAATAAVGQGRVESLPDAPSAVTAQAHSLNEVVEEARSPVRFGDAGVYIRQMSRSTLVASGGTGYRHQGEDFDARLHKLLYPTAVKRPPISADDGSLIGRGMRAAFRALIMHDDSGSGKLNTAYLLRTVTAVVADTGSTPYWRRHRGDPFSDFGAMVGNDSGMNLWHEFGPGIGHLVVSHTPKFVSKIQGHVGHK